MKVEQDRIAGEAVFEETVLFALIGLSPAVLTETIWALADEGDAGLPDRIVVCTTTKGRDRLTESFFTRGVWEEFLQALEIQKRVQVTGKLRFGPVSDSIRVIATHARDRELEDIVSTEDNEAVGNFLLENLRPFTENQVCRLIVSIAGGRKTMGALLLTVMTLIGRSTDRVCHVLVPEPWDRITDAFYPSPGKRYRNPDSGASLEGADMNIRMAEIPFIPLRHAFPGDIERFCGSYPGLVNRIRNRTNQIEDSLSVYLDPGKGICRLCGMVIDLSAREFLFYYYFVDRAVSGVGPLGVYSEFSVDDAEQLISPYCGSADFSHWSQDARTWLRQIEPDEDLRKIAQSIRSKAAKAGLDPLAVSRLVPGRGYLGIELSPSKITLKT